MSRNGPAVYAAEREVFGARFRGLDVAPGMIEATTLVHRYLGDAWVVERTRGRLDAGSRCWPGRITLSQDAGLPIVLHEMAHGLCPSVSGHGLDFQRAYLALVAQEMGPRWAIRLRAAFIRHRTRGHRSLEVSR